MKRRTISHFFEQKNLVKRRKMALLGKHQVYQEGWKLIPSLLHDGVEHDASLPRRVEANSQFGNWWSSTIYKFTKKGRS